MEDSMVAFVGRMMPILDEKEKRLFLGGLSKALGHGAEKELAEITGITIQTISAGRKEYALLAEDPRAKPSPSETGRTRAPGGGRKPVTDRYPGLMDFLRSLLEHEIAGNPMNNLLWTTLSAMDISREAAKAGMPVSDVTVIKLLNSMGVSLQQNKKYTESGDAGPNRAFQFTAINLMLSRFIRDGQPVISVDTKKKELLGDYKNAGREYRPFKSPRMVKDHDFVGEEGKAVPYGIYDVGRNEGFVNVGVSADTAEFAVNSIMEWWNRVGKRHYPDAQRIMITADCGGSNGRRCRLWKQKLQEFSDATGLQVYVCHFPPGTSKWNKIEHRMFSQISISWRGKPLKDLVTVVNLIGAVTTDSGLRIECVADEREYERGIRLDKKYIDELNIDVFKCTDGWNYRISPRQIIKN